MAGFTAAGVRLGKPPCFVFSGRVLTKVRAFRDFDSIESQQLFSLLPFLQDWPQNTPNYHPGKNLLVEQNLC